VFTVLANPVATFATESTELPLLLAVCFLLPFLRFVRRFFDWLSLLRNLSNKCLYNSRSDKLLSTRNLNRWILRFPLLVRVGTSTYRLPVVDVTSLTFWAIFSFFSYDTCDFLFII
jgi:hypothetical protein